MRSSVYATVGRPSVRLCVCPSVSWPPHAAAAGLLLWARRPGDIDRLLHGRRAGGQQQPRRSTAHSSECGQYHVVSICRKLNTELVCHSRARVCDSVRIVCGRVRPSVLSCAAATACGGFAAVGPAGRRYRSIAAQPARPPFGPYPQQHGGQQQMRAVPRLQRRRMLSTHCQFSSRSV